MELKQLAMLYELATFSSSDAAPIWVQALNCLAVHLCCIDKTCYLKTACCVTKTNFACRSHFACYKLMYVVQLVGAYMPF